MRVGAVSSLMTDSFATVCRSSDLSSELSTTFALPSQRKPARWSASFGVSKPLRGIPILGNLSVIIPNGWAKTGMEKEEALRTGGVAKPFTSNRLGGRSH